MVLPGTEIIIGIHGILASHSDGRGLKLHPAKGARAEDYVTPYFWTIVGDIYHLEATDSKADFSNSISSDILHAISHHTPIL